MSPDLSGDKMLGLVQEYPISVFVRQLERASNDSQRRDVVLSQKSAVQTMHPSFAHDTQLSEHSTHIVSSR